MPVSDARHRRRRKEERNREKENQRFKEYSRGKETKDMRLSRALNLGLHIIDYQEYFTVTGL
jgi:hypothetical protein